MGGSSYYQRGMQKRKRSGWSASGNRANTSFFTKFEPISYLRAPQRPNRILSAAQSNLQFMQRSLSATPNQPAGGHLAEPSGTLAQLNNYGYRRNNRSLSPSPDQNLNNQYSRPVSSPFAYQQRTETAMSR